MRDSEFFRWGEMLVTSSGLPNTPPLDLEANIEDTLHRMDEVRRALGKPVRITSGFRSPAVNKAIGGAATSDHCKGLSADFVCGGMTPEAICKVIIDAGIEFDQLIAEHRGSSNWVHIGFGTRMRGEVLTFRDGKYTVGLG